MLEVSRATLAETPVFSDFFSFLLFLFFLFLPLFLPLLFPSVGGEPQGFYSPNKSPAKGKACARLVYIARARLPF